MCPYHLLKQPVLSFFRRLQVFEAENINFVEYFVIDNHFFEQIFRKVEPESLLYQFLNSRDPLRGSAVFPENQVTFKQSA